MFHRHKWTKWSLYTQDMLRVTRFGEHPYVREFQQRECTTCGKIKQREL